jgi:hypothetical protein
MLRMYVDIPFNYTETTTLMSTKIDMNILVLGQPGFNKFHFLLLTTARQWKIFSYFVVYFTTPFNNKDYIASNEMLKSK